MLETSPNNPGNSDNSNETYMLREIREQPTSLRHTLDETLDAVRRLAEEVKQRNVSLIVIAARGTSDHAALYAQYLFQYLNGIPVALATPSLYTLYGTSLRLERAMVIGISQSGQSPDIVEVVAQAKAAGALTVGITNIAESPLAMTAQHALLCHAGPERSVAATKTYTTTCTVLAMLAAYISGGEPLREGIQHIPQLVTDALNSEERIASIAQRYTHARNCVVLGRTFQYSTARETALKLEETCYLVATPFSTADFRHGPAALAERGLPVVVYAPPGPTLEGSRELLTWLREREADCLVVSEDEALLELATVPILLTLSSLRHNSMQGQHASISELVAPIPYIVCGQLLAHYLALSKGLNPDQPRSLTKVTRTM